MARTRRTSPPKTPIAVVNPYAQVIDVLIGKWHDPNAMVALLAKERPELFMELYEKTRQVEAAVENQGWQREVVKLVSTAQRVAAIKLLRQHTGYGLKEAKDICDHVHNHMAKTDSRLTSFAVGLINDPGHQAILAQLIRNCDFY